MAVSAKRLGKTSPNKDKDLAASGKPLGGMTARLTPSQEPEA